MIFRADAFQAGIDLPVQGVPVAWVHGVGQFDAEAVLFRLAKLGIGAGELAYGEVDQALVGTAASEQRTQFPVEEGESLGPF